MNKFSGSEKTISLKKIQYLLLTNLIHYLATPCSSTQCWVVQDIISTLYNFRQDGHILLDDHTRDNSVTY